VCELNLNSLIRETNRVELKERHPGKEIKFRKYTVDESAEYI